MLRGRVTKTRPTFVAVGLRSGAGAGAVTINKPTGTLENDLMVAVYSYSGTGRTWTQPAGWTEVLEYGATAAGIGVAWKIATASEASTYAFQTSGGGTQINGFIVTYRGAAFDVIGSVAVSGTSTSVVISGITVSENLSILLSFVSQNTTGVTFTPASGFSSLASQLGNSPASQIWSKNIESGATGNQTFTSTSSGSITGVLFSIKPA